MTTRDEQIVMKALEAAFIACKENFDGYVVDDWDAGYNAGVNCCADSIRSISPASVLKEEK